VVDSHLPAIDDWNKRVDKLKWILHNQIEVLGTISACEQLIDALIVAPGDEIPRLLPDLVYECHFLSLDLSGLFYELEYSTWNLLDFLDPDHYFGLRAIPSSVLDKVEALRPGPPILASSIHRFFEELTHIGVDQRNVEFSKVALSEWLQCASSYRESVLAFYEAESEVEMLYMFHYTVSAALRLLSVSLSTNIALKPIRNQANHFFLPPAN
jgi:hypothetical protein